MSPRKKRNCYTNRRQTNCNPGLKYTEPVKIVCAPDSFKESISAVAAARAMAEGIRAVMPDAIVDTCPVGDGGEGTLDALLESIHGEKKSTTARNAFGVAVRAGFGHFSGPERSYVESAEVVGLQSIPAHERRVMKASSYGVGELLLAASGTRSILVGVGGSASNDGGCGMAQAIGCRFLDDRGIEMTAPMCGELLREITHVDISTLDARLAGCRIEVACDVTNPLTGPNGAAFVFAPQKGATASEVVELDSGLQHLAEVVHRDLGVDIAAEAGSGAAGGLAGGLIAFAGATLRSGIEAVLAAVGFDERIRTADLCLTGEGRLDAQTLSGKACAGVAGAAADYGVPTVALVGSASDGAARSPGTGLDDVVVIGEGMSKAASMANVETLLATAAGRIARKYGGRDRSRR